MVNSDWLTVIDDGSYPRVNSHMTIENGSFIADLPMNIVIFYSCTSWPEGRTYSMLKKMEKHREMMWTNVERENDEFRTDSAQDMPMSRKRTKFI